MRIALPSILRHLGLTTIALTTIALTTATALAAQTPANPSSAAEALPRDAILWSLAAGVASGSKGLAAQGAVGTRYRRRALELRLSYAEASAPGGDLRGPIDVKELAYLGGIATRTRRTASSVRLGLGGIKKTQCVQHCGFFEYVNPEVQEVRYTVGLAYALETGVTVGRRPALGLAAIVFGNANTAQSFVSGGGKVSLGWWK